MLLKLTRLEYLGNNAYKVGPNIIIDSTNIPKKEVECSRVCITAGNTLFHVAQTIDEIWNLIYNSKGQ